MESQGKNRSMNDGTTREHIVDAADRLFYRQGYEHTSFSDVAQAVRISRGNFYYHFRTKDEILDAVIERRLSSTRRMLEQWQAEESDPAARIRRFVHILVANRSKIMRHGCPVGTLCSELAKLDHVAQAGANRIMALFRDWLRGQFAQLGRKADADALALHLLARSQGVATLANAFHDRKFIQQEVDLMCDWVASCAHPAGKRRPRPRRASGPVH